MCHVRGSCLVGTEVDGRLYCSLETWHPPEVYIIVVLQDDMPELYSMCTKWNYVIIWYVLRPIHNAELAVLWLHMAHKHTLEAASPRNVSWDPEPADGSTWHVLWTAEAVRVIIWCSALIVKCILSIPLVVRHATIPKRRVHWQLHMVHTQTVALGVWIWEQTCLDESAYWSS